MFIFLDMDGVIANFVDGAIEAAGLPITHDCVRTWDFFTPFMSVDEFWGHIHGTYEFWEGLEPYDWAHTLVDMCCDAGEVVFLSDSSHDECAPTGKVKWLKRHGFLNGTASNYLLGHQKNLVATQSNILIDDSIWNCSAWRKFVLFPQPWNTEDKQCLTTRLDFVEQQLRYLSCLS
jgi:hypothetical protein